MTSPTLMICIGAQKAGTSWLYSYLRAHPDCHLRGLKELDYFSCLDGRDPGCSIPKRRAALDALVRAPGRWRRLFRPTPRQRALHDLLAALESARSGGDHGRYVDYLCRGRKGQALVADITPSYAALGEAEFAEMLTVMSDVRIVYVLRDPIDRLWSQARKVAATERKATDVDGGSRWLVKRFDAEATPALWAFSNYKRTLDALRNAVPEDRLLVMFFEDLFAPASVERLCAFLGIRFHPADYDARVNPGVPVDLEPTERKRLAGLMKDQYDACARWFDGTLPQRWREHMAEV